MVGGTKKIVRNEFSLYCKEVDPRICENSIFGFTGFTISRKYKLLEKIFVMLCQLNNISPIK